MAAALAAACLTAWPGAATAQAGADAATVRSTPAVDDLAARQAQARALRSRAQELAARGRLDRAFELYSRAIDAYPAFPLVHNEIGALFAKRGAYVRAEASFRSATTLDPSFAEAWANLAEVRRRLKRYAAAEETYARFLELRPGDADAYDGLARVYQAQSRSAEALWAIDRYLELQQEPQSPSVVAARQVASELIGQGVRAQRPVGLSVATDGATGEATGETTGEAASTAASDEGAGSAQAAADGGETAAATEPAGGKGWGTTQAGGAREPGPLSPHPGDEDFARQRYGDALRAYVAAYEGAPGDVELAYKIGATFAVMGDFHGALRWWRRALALAPDRALVAYHLALATLRARERTGAAEPAGTDVPALAAARRSLEAGQPEAALAALAYRPGVEAAYLRGEAALATGQLDLAHESFQRVLARDPEDHAALGGLVEADLRRGRAAEAREAMQRWLGETTELPEQFVVLRAHAAATRIEVLGAADVE